jgi:hypothetical protein
MMAMGIFNDKMAMQRVGSSGALGDKTRDELETAVRGMKLFEHMTPTQLKVRSTLLVGRSYSAALETEALCAESALAPPPILSPTHSHAPLPPFSTSATTPLLHHVVLREVLGRVKTARRQWHPCSTVCCSRTMCYTQRANPPPKCSWCWRAAWRSSRRRVDAGTERALLKSLLNFEGPVENPIES